MQYINYNCCHCYAHVALPQRHAPKKTITKTIKYRALKRRPWYDNLQVHAVSSGSVSFHRIFLECFFGELIFELPALQHVFLVYTKIVSYLKVIFVSLLFSLFTYYLLLTKTKLSLRVARFMDFFSLFVFRNYFSSFFLTASEPD